MKKQIAKYILTFFCIYFLLAGLLVMAAMIPKVYIKKNVEESAVYLCEGELFGEAVRNADGSIIDRYADSILLGIAYSYDSNSPLCSVMESKYYHRDAFNENENLLKAVTDDCIPNQQYLRYWHGSNIFVRPLLTVFNLKQIYTLNGIIIGSLGIVVSILLIRKRAFFLLTGFIIGLIMTSSWFVPLSLEYTWTYLIMMVMIIAVMVIADNNKDAGLVFLIGGMVTGFMDFLSTETITLTVPLLFLLWSVYGRIKKPGCGLSFNLAVKAVITWGIGYAGMWILKWITASVVLAENVMPYISEHMKERIGFGVGAGAGRFIIGAVTRNISCLFPFDYGSFGIFMGIVFLILIFYIGYVYRKKQVDKKFILILGCIGIIPYIRYIVLHNHSYLHYFFTYRAQIATIIAVALILEQLLKKHASIGNLG